MLTTLDDDLPVPSADSPFDVWTTSVLGVLVAVWHEFTALHHDLAHQRDNARRGKTLRTAIDKHGLEGSFNSLFHCVGYLMNTDNIDLLQLLKLFAAIIQRLLKRFRRYHYALLSLIYCFFHHFFEFPNGMRHPCTTMPWTIWPSLVILWGVCWMFYWPEQHDKEYGLLDEQMPAVDVQDHWLDEYIDYSTPKIDDCWPVYNPLLAANAGSGPLVTAPLQHMNSPDILRTEARAICRPAQVPQTTSTTNTNSAQQMPAPSSRNQESPAPSASKPSSLCPHCNKTYSRTDALRRHLREQHPDSQSNRDEGAKIFRCPHKECHKSFKRYERLRKHLKTCKVHKRIQSMNGNALSATGDNAAPARTETLQNESEVSTQGGPTSESDGGDTSSEVAQRGGDLIGQLQTRLAMEREKLDKKEMECQQSRNLLAHIESLIKTLQNEYE